MPIAAHMTRDAASILQRLVRFDTTNPPGNEAACVAYVADVLRAAGARTRVLASDPRRPNLVARVPGRGLAPPLLLHAHVDVVPAGEQQWTHPPFDGRRVDGHIWGRGTIDMKGGLAMMLAALVRLHEQETPPAGDVLLAVVADEEAGSAAGAGFLVARHRELFDGVRHAVGEDGGADLELDGSIRVHPVVVAEKRACWLRATLRGPGGHASRAPLQGSAVSQLARLLAALGDGVLEQQTTPPVERMLAELGRAAPAPLARHLARLRDDPADAVALAALSPRDRQYIRSVTAHTANVTVVRAGTKTNIVPSQVTVEIDGRLLPGRLTTEGFLALLRRVTGVDAALEVLVEGVDMPEPRVGPFFDLLADVTRELDPGGLPLPMMTTASTDARLFKGIGIECFGWLPLGPVPGRYRHLLHSADERIPVTALTSGAEGFRRLLLRYRFETDDYGRRSGYDIKC